MGKFDGYLLVSDWDGTIRYDGNINPKNIEKIKYFKENGGLFTICTGRYPSYLKENGFFDVIPNTYLLALNGAIIADIETDEYIYEGVMKKEALLAFDTAVNEGFSFNYFMFYPKGSTEGTKFLKDEYLKYRDKLTQSTTYKMIIVTNTEEEAIPLRDRLREVMPDTYEIARSWATGIEIIYKENSKGVNVKKLKEMTGCHTLIAVGDYENDTSMLQSADISYAVENAAIEVKMAAKRSAPHVTEGAIAFIIDELDKALL